MSWKERWKNLLEDLGTSARSFAFGDPPDEEEGEEEVVSILEGASAEDVLDLMVLLRLRHEDTLKVSLDDIAKWTDIEHREVQRFYHSDLWRQFWHRCSFSLDERRTMYNAVLYLLNFAKDEAIGDVVAKLVSADATRQKRGDDEDEAEAGAERAATGQKVRKAVMDRYYYSMIIQSRIACDDTVD